MVDKIIKVSAPGKIILSGEHSVVYGQPALVAAINKRLYVTIQKGNGQTKIITDQNPKIASHALFNVIPQYFCHSCKSRNLYKSQIDHLKIKIHSQIPINRGLGSSAALAVAMTGALFRWLNQEWDKNLINQTAFEIEKKQHQNPSGCDNSIATFGGMIIFQKGKMKPLALPNFPDSPDFPCPPQCFSFWRANLLLIDSGPAAESTGEMVKLVKCQVSSVKCKNIISKLGQTTNHFLKILTTPISPISLIALISQNERLLEELGVVGKRAQKIIKAIETLGGAAKICGAGGLKKGSGILLCFHPQPSTLFNFAQEKKLPSFPFKIDFQGVRYEQ